MSRAPSRFFVRRHARQAGEDGRSDQLFDRAETRCGEPRTGVEVIDIEVHEPTARLTLNAVNTAFASVTVDAGAERADLKTRGTAGDRCLDQGA